MQRRQCAGDAEVAPRSIPIHTGSGTKSSIARAAAMAARKGKKIISACVSFSRPGRIDLSKRGAAVPMTLNAKSSFAEVQRK
jgi:hypothetical protein